MSVKRDKTKVKDERYKNSLVVSVLINKYILLKETLCIRKKKLINSECDGKTKAMDEIEKNRMVWWLDTERRRYLVERNRIECNMDYNSHI